MKVENILLGENKKSALTPQRKNEYQTLCFLADEMVRKIEKALKENGEYTANTKYKLTDPVTYDYDGNVIPLSERFDSKNSDIRYMAKGTAEDIQFCQDIRQKV